MVDEFKVSFGKIARTLRYEDHLGAMTFCFDVAPSESPEKKEWTVFLGRGVLNGEGTELLPKSERSEIAFERAMSYLSSCGYEVAIDE